MPSAWTVDLSSALARRCGVPSMTAARTTIAVAYHFKTIAAITGALSLPPREKASDGVERASFYRDGRPTAMCVRRERTAGLCACHARRLRVPVVPSLSEGPLPSHRPESPIDGHQPASARERRHGEGTDSEGAVGAAVRGSAGERKGERAGRGGGGGR